MNLRVELREKLCNRWTDRRCWWLRWKAIWILFNKPRLYASMFKALCYLSLSLHDVSHSAPFQGWAFWSCRQHWKGHKLLWSISVPKVQGPLVRLLTDSETELFEWINGINPGIIPRPVSFYLSLFTEEG